MSETKTDKGGKEEEEEEEVKEE
jgi:hypothetical protein